MYILKIIIYTENNDRDLLPKQKLKLHLDFFFFFFFFLINGDNESAQTTIDWKNISGHENPLPTPPHPPPP